MRSSSRAGFLLFALVLALVVGSRVVRLSLPWWLLIASIVLLVAVAIGVGRAFGGGVASAVRQPPPRNVTPEEPTIAAGAGPVPATRTPEIVVVEPTEDATARLEAKLQALDRLRANGLVSDAEYEAKRARLIAEF
jgi:hypothetical protein